MCYMEKESTIMDNIPDKGFWTSLILKLGPPILLSAMVKVASEYKKTRRLALLSSLVIILLAGCGAIVGYWITQYLGWTEYKMTLTIFSCGIFADKIFEVIFSKTFINGMFNYLEDALKENLTIIIKRLGKKD